MHLGEILPKRVHARSCVFVCVFMCACVYVYECAGVYTAVKTTCVPTQLRSYPFFSLKCLSAHLCALPRAHSLCALFYVRAPLRKMCVFFFFIKSSSFLNN